MVTRHSDDGAEAGADVHDAYIDIFGLKIQCGHSSPGASR
jgi:hypothetical protein